MIRPFSCALMALFFVTGCSSESANPEPNREENPVDSSLEEEIIIVETPLQDNATLEESLDENKEIKKVIDGQLKAFQKEDLEKAYSEFTTQEFQEATSIKKFKSFVKGYPILRTFQAMRIGDVQLGTDIVIVHAKLENGKETWDAEYTLVNKDNVWKVWALSVAPEDIKKYSLTQDEKESLVDTVKRQIALLQSDEIEKAYADVTAKEFQKETSLPLFKKFIKEYPIFFESKKTVFGDIIRDHHAYVLPVLLESDSMRSKVEYRLTKEDGAWKIWSFQIVETVSTEKPLTLNSKDLEQTVQELLKALKNQDLTEAYHNFTTRGFKETTSQDAFEFFIAKHPVFSRNKSTTFEEAQFQNNIGTFHATLLSEDNLLVGVNYRLSYEDGKWKVLSMEVLQNPIDSDKAMDTAPLEFFDVQIGKETDAKGVLINPALIFNGLYENMIVNVFVHHGKKGETIELVMEHVETGSKASPIDSTLTKDGDSMVSFVLTPPSAGWPQGNYQFHLSATSGIETTIPFKIE